MNYVLYIVTCLIAGQLIFLPIWYIAPKNILEKWPFVAIFLIGILSGLVGIATVKPNNGGFQDQRTVESFVFLMISYLLAYFFMKRYRKTTSV
jgi:hypothetical protein